MAQAQSNCYVGTEKSYVKPSGNGQSVPIDWWYPEGGLTASDAFLSEVWWVEGTAASDGEVGEAPGVEHDEDILRRDARPAAKS